MSEIDIKNPIIRLKYLNWSAEDLINELRNSGWVIRILNEETGYVITCVGRPDNELTIMMENEKIIKIF